MLATQYTIALPADYDMSRIRRRVAERGHLLDDRPGLTLKAYLVQDRTAGGLVNEYAPFYLWADPAAAASFLWGGAGFSGIVQDFGRPAVSTWVAVEVGRGATWGTPPVAATLERRLLPPGEDPSVAAGRLRATTAGRLADPDVHSVAGVIDPTRWESAVLTLSAVRPSLRPDATLYEVLHVSTPGSAAPVRTRVAHGGGSLLPTPDRVPPATLGSAVPMAVVPDARG